jgi:hypothetical protein
MKRLAALVPVAFVAAACSPRPKGPGPMRIVAGNHRIAVVPLR